MVVGVVRLRKLRMYNLFDEEDVKEILKDDYRGKEKYTPYESVIESQTKIFSSEEKARKGISEQDYLDKVPLYFGDVPASFGGSGVSSVFEREVK